jgi:ATP-dependent DNA helicase RecQ
LVIEPRRQWPRDLEGVSGNIPADLRVQDGRALSQYGDAGWGELVRRARREGQPYDDRLVAGAADLVRTTWRPDPPPAWVTCLPGSAAGALVDFAGRLADRLELPFVPAVTQVRSTDDQGRMENSAQQVRNVLGAFEVSGDIPSGPVLLIDEVVDSRWTLTVVGVALREAGAGPVLPLALAKAHGD